MGDRRTVLLSADASGGIFSHALALSRALVSRGARVVLAIMGGPLSVAQRSALGQLPDLALHESSYRLEWMDDPWEDVARAGAWLLEIEDRTRPDVVHLNGYAHGALPFRAPKIVAAHTSVLSWFEAVEGRPAPPRFDRYRREVAAGMAAATALCAPTRAMLDTIVRHHGPHPRARVIANGCEPDRFRPAAVKEETILSIGRVWDQAENIAALSAVARALPWPVRVAGHEIAGSSARRPLPDLDDLGALGENALADTLARAAVYAAPARHEPFGLSILEAACSGCALVLGDIPSLRELWGGAALFVDPGDPLDLQRALAGLAGNPGVRAALGDRARLRAREYSSDRMGLAYLALYEEVLARPTLRTPTQRPPALAPPRSLTPGERPASSAPPASRARLSPSERPPSLAVPLRLPRPHRSRWLRRCPSRHRRPRPPRRRDLRHRLRRCDGWKSARRRPPRIRARARAREDRMRVVIFCHSIISDWNHGNAHFLRGVVTELDARGHEVRVFEPEDAWSLKNLVSDHGAGLLEELHAAFPAIEPERYRPGALDLEAALSGADLVLVHEWNDPDLIRRIGEHRARAGSYRLFFHDTYHRSATDPDSIASLDLSAYDGVLAFGRSVAERYLANGWTRRAFVWHQAADTSTFYPHEVPKDLDLVWIGNYGEGARTAELDELLLGPVRDLGLRAVFYGVRYPESALAALSRAGVAYGGYLPNHRVPRMLARARLTIHVPRRPYVDALPGIPTVRPFEALACGVPLVCGPWHDTESVFEVGRDYLVARDGAEMRRHLSDLLDAPSAAAAMAEHGRWTLLGRHTCMHRVDELLAIVERVSR
ncbi:Glycosyltransferase [Minicystis rosea]|nr:Glycosyltransferase [Minicystis rosea]